MKTFHGSKIIKEFYHATRCLKFRVLENGVVFMSIPGRGIWREISQQEFNQIQEVA